MKEPILIEGFGEVLGCEPLTKGESQWKWPESETWSMEVNPSDWHGKMEYYMNRNGRIYLRGKGGKPKLMVDSPGLLEEFKEAGNKYGDWIDIEIGT